MITFTDFPRFPCQYLRRYKVDRHIYAHSDGGKESVLGDCLRGCRWHLHRHGCIVYGDPPHQAKVSIPICCDCDASDSKAGNSVTTHIYHGTMINQVQLLQPAYQDLAMMRHE